MVQGMGHFQHSALQTSNSWGTQFWPTVTSYRISRVKHGQAKYRLEPPCEQRFVFLSILWNVGPTMTGASFLAIQLSWFLFYRSQHGFAVLKHPRLISKKQHSTSMYRWFHIIHVHPSICKNQQVHPVISRFNDLSVRKIMPIVGGAP